MASELASAEACYEAEEMEEALALATKAVSQLRACGDTDRVTEALRLEALCLVGTGRPNEAAELARAELAVCRGAGDKKGEAMMLLSMGSASMEKRGPKGQEEALQCVSEARALFGELGDRSMEAEALQLLSHIAARRPEPERRKGGLEALALASCARELSVALGDRRLEARSLHHLAGGHAAAGDFEACLQVADEALDLYLELKDERMEAFELLAMAQWSLENNQPDRALSDAEEALEIYQRVRSPKELAAFKVIFDAYMKKGDTRRALRTAKAGLKRFRAIGDKAGEGEALDMLVSACVAAEELEEALEAAERALAIFQDIGNRQLEAKLSSAVSGLHLRMCRFDRALQLAEDAATLYRESGGDTAQKTEAMFNIVESHMQKKDQDAALQAATEMRNHFQKEADAKGQAAALMAMCQVSMQMDKYDDAVASATRAQVILGEDGSQYGEAAALRMLAEAYSRKGEHKSAVRAAERSRTIFRELGERDEEANSLYVVCQESVALAVAEGARVGGGPGSRAATDALGKAAKSAEGAVKMARELASGQALLGCALCVLAQVHMLNGKPEEALQTADEAVVLFRDIGSMISEANALLLSADALRVTRQYKEAGDAAEEALRLFRSLDPHYEKGEEFAQEILSYLEQVKQQQQQQQQQIQMQQQAMRQPMGNVQFQPQEQGSEMPAQAVSVARQERERGPALDLSRGADVAAIRAKVLEIATRITGAEEGEIDTDTPLMEAGLTSNSAIILRDELAQELPGVQLPVTLVFDYPSVGAMADLIVESSAAKALRG